MNNPQTFQPMIETPDAVAAVSERIGLLARDFTARVLNYSPTGCLLETSSPVEVGTVGTLCFIIDGRELTDDVQVVRCQPIHGAGSLFQVGAKFLWTSSTGSQSLRYALLGAWALRSSP